MSPEEIYAKLTPEQRATVAKEYQNNGVGTGQTIDPNNVTPQHLVAMHEEAQKNNPGVLQRIRSHPLIAGVLVGIGAFEADKHFGHGH